jgi:hypothetical protein
MCITTVPVTRGEIVMGGLWQREQFCMKTSSPFFCPLLRTAGAGGFCSVFVWAPAYNFIPLSHTHVATVATKKAMRYGDLRFVNLFPPWPERPDKPIREADIPEIGILC